MATLKHLGSKNADYGAAEQYLLFEHDEFTMKPVLDENGRLIPREDYRLSTLNCGGEDFAVACMRSNLRYEKNQRREDVKSHHYIISFDPRDGPDNGLTVDRAQALGEQFCKEHFPGHQALVCTHPDGHNHSGNIHVHIVINSLRIEEVPFLPYMDRPADTKAGCKHRCTDAALRYFKSEVMEMCHREGLYQIDLLNGSKNRVTDREYWAQKKGQAALDKQNAPMIAGGITPRQTKFETNKEKLRQTLRKALATAASFDEFSSLLLREGVTVKESRGRLSYLTPDRTKPITARKLGGDFDRTAVLAVLEQNAQRGVTVRYTPQHQAARAAEQTAAIPEYLHAGKGRLQGEKTGKIDPRQDSVQRLVDIEQKMAEGKGKGYERWAKIHNLKQAAKTLTIYQQYGFSSPEQLEAAVATAYQDQRRTESTGNEAAREKGVAATGTCLCQDQAHPRGAESAEIRESPRRIPPGKRERFYHSRSRRPVFQGTGAYQAARPKSVAGRDRAAYLRERRPVQHLSRTEAAVQGVADRQAEHRPDFAPGRAAPQKGAEP